MLARLLLALLFAAFALPSAAPAACHDAPAAHRAMPSVSPKIPMTGDHPDRQAPAIHACIGCVPPSDWTGPRIERPWLPIATRLIAEPTTLATGAAPAPDLPPPRRG